MLSLHLAKIRTAREQFEQVFELAQIAPDEGFRVARPVALALDIYKDNDLFRLVGSVKTALELTCSRCLEPFIWPLDSSFDLRYQPFRANIGEGEHQVGEDDLSTAFYENGEIDLGQLMKEQFHLALPMKPLCSDHCKGLCPECGTNLNRGACTCAPTWEDPRLAALKHFRTKN